MNHNNQPQQQYHLVLMWVLMLMWMWVWALRDLFAYGMIWHVNEEVQVGGEKKWNTASPMPPPPPHHALADTYIKINYQMTPFPRTNNATAEAIAVNVDANVNVDV